MSARLRLKRLALFAAEACGSLLLVLALFWIFIAFLYTLFPSGTPLRELVESRGGAPAPPRLHSMKRQVEATLTFMLRDVRLRRGNSVAWGGAREGMQLYSQDAVLTFDQSGAGIAFSRSDRIDVGSNSLVVVTRLDEGEDAEKRSYRVKVDGEVRGNLSAGRKLAVELAAAGHLARIAPGVARFRVTPYGSRGATLAVYAGEARVVDDGRTVRVPANFGVILTKGMTLGPVIPLPAAPSLVESGEASYRYRLLPPVVRIAWSGPPSGDYHLQLSTDPGFGNCLYDERLRSPKFATGKLDQGSYFWRVSRVDCGLEGGFSRVGRCELVQVLRAPELRVAFPAESPEAGPYRLSGWAESGSRVFVDGVELPRAGAGKFERELSLRPGVNLVRVEALDGVGNASYASRLVYGGIGKKGEEQAAR